MTRKYQQSEATADRRRMLLYLVDATDGKTPETGLSSGFTIEISKNGAAQGSGGGSITEIGDGFYYYEFTATELNTLGFIAISIRHANCRDFAGEVQVVAYDPYDNFTTNINDIETDTNEIQGKLPSNYMMGSSVNTDKDDEIDAIKAKTDNLPADPASETNVNANETKIDTIDGIVDAILIDTSTTLDNKLDTIDGIVDTILVDTGTTLDGKINTIDSNVDSIKAKTDNLPSDTNDLLLQQLGLQDKNSYVDLVTVDGSGRMTGCRKRVYNSKANAQSHGATGLLYTFTVTVTYDGDDLESYLVVLD